MGRKAVRNFQRRWASGQTFNLADLVQGLARSLFDPYRPELHYMRGPGPKWHAKHDPAPATMQHIPIPARIRVKA